MFGSDDSIQPNSRSIYIYIYILYAIIRLRTFFCKASLFILKFHIVFASFTTNSFNSFSFRRPCYDWYACRNTIQLGGQLLDIYCHLYDDLQQLCVPCMGIEQEFHKNTAFESITNCENCHLFLQDKLQLKDYTYFKAFKKIKLP